MSFEDRLMVDTWRRIYTLPNAINIWGGIFHCLYPKIKLHYLRVKYSEASVPKIRRTLDKSLLEQLWKSGLPCNQIAVVLDMPSPEYVSALIGRMRDYHGEDRFPRRYNKKRKPIYTWEEFTTRVKDAQSCDSA